jgi:hypothetical protein
VKVELDHVFVLCAAGGPEAEVLVRAGLTEGPGNTHPGQGTACRRFFFARQYLELLWVSDAAEAQGPLAHRTRTSAGLLSIVTASAHALHVTSDHGTSGGMIDLRPDLPLAMRW